MYDADTVRVWVEEDERVLGSGAPLVVERPLHAVEGSGRWLLKSKSRITLMDGSFGVAGLMTDVTALKQAQAQAQSARELLDAVIDAVPTVVSLKDEAGRWVLLNRAFRDFHDRPGSDYLGKTDEEVYGPAVAARHRGRTPRPVPATRCCASTARSRPWTASRAGWCGASAASRCPAAGAACSPPCTT